MMRKLFFAFMVTATIALVGCNNEDSGAESPNQKLNITNLRAAGKVVPETKFDLNRCKPGKSKETLESFRYVGPLPLYYMDYTADVDWNQLLNEGDEEHRIGLYEIAETTKRKNELIFTAPLPSGEQPKHNACSGFVCHNKAGELLFCRNFDDATDPMIVIFNKNVRPGEYRNVMMSPWSDVDPNNLEKILLQPTVV